MFKNTFFHEAPLVAASEDREVLHFSQRLLDCTKYEWKLNGKQTSFFVQHMILLFDEKID